MSERLLTEHEVVARLRINMYSLAGYSLSQLAKSGLLPKVTRNGETGWTKESVDNYLAYQREEASFGKGSNATRIPDRRN